jgi:pantothenate kinase type III
MPNNHAKLTRKPAHRVLQIACAATLAAIVSGCGYKYVFVDADALCESWKHQTVSKDDKLTQGTAEIADGNNKSRPKWQCQYGENRAKS